MSIFITGATGYIGGTIAAKLVEQGKEVRGLVRDLDKAEKLRNMGVTPVLGTLDNSALLTNEARRSEGVINAADSDHRGAVEALIEGLSGSGKPFLHTSGTGLFADHAYGEYASGVIHDDLLPLNFKKNELADRAKLDQHIRNASNQNVRSVVLCNTNIYGWGKGLNTKSIQVPWLIREAIIYGEAFYVGQGANIWSNVHIDDLVDLYLLAFEKAPAGSFYFVENGENNYKDTAVSIAKRFKLGKVRSWSLEETRERESEIFAFVFGSNSRVRAKRALIELNWQPKRSSLLEWIEQEA